MLYLCIFNFMSLPFVTDALLISKNASGLILSNSFRIVKTSIISPKVLRLWKENMSNCFNSFSYDKLRNVEISFVPRLCTLFSIF